MIQKPLKVVHYRSCFLPVTENWIYNQVIGLDEVWVILARQVANVICLRAEQAVLVASHAATTCSVRGRRDSEDS